MKLRVQPEMSAENPQAPLVPAGAISISDIRSILAAKLPFSIEIAADRQLVECRTLQTNPDLPRAFRLMLRFSVPPFHEGRNILNISGFHVLERRQGIGKITLANIVRLAIKAGCDGLSLGASEDGGLFWARAGFRAKVAPSHLSATVDELGCHYPEDMALIRKETDPAQIVWKASDFTKPDWAGQPSNRRLLVNDIEGWPGELLFSDQEAVDRLCKFLETDRASLGFRPIKERGFTKG